MVTEIFPQVFDITCREIPGRRYRAFLVDDPIPTLFDTGFAETMDRLFAGIDEIGVEPERLVITHGHADHTEGFDQVVERYGVETWVPEDTHLASTHSPDHRFGDGARIGPFEAVHVPGHAPGNSAFIDEARSLAILGDIVFESSLRGLPAGYPVLPPAIYSDDLNAAEENLERVLPYEFETGLVYHGKSRIENARTKLERFVDFPGKPD